MDGNAEGLGAASRTPPLSAEPTSRFFTHDGLRLHYLDWGNEGAAPLLLIHGLRDHARSWDATARALCQDWHVMALDLRGHGDSDWSPDGAYLTAYHVLDLAALVDELGDQPLTVVAHSFGGSVALRYIAACPERIRRLALVEGLGPSPAIRNQWAQEGPASRMREWISSRRKSGAGHARPFPSLDEGIRRLKAVNPLLSAAQAQHLAEHGTRAGEEGFRWKYDLRVSCFAPEEFIDLDALCGSITQPTLLFYGAESWASNPLKDGRAACFPQARTVVVEGAGHWLHHDQFETFITALRAFL